VIISLVFIQLKLGTDTDWKTLAAGIDYTLSIKSNGALWAWGMNGTFEDLMAIMFSKVLDNNTTCTFSIQSGRDPDCFEWIEHIINQQILFFPTQIGTDADWQTVSKIGGHTVAIKTDGTLWAWGTNTHGQLGLGDYINRNYPIQIGTDNDWELATAGNGHTVAIKTDGTLWIWGHNSYSKLGLGNDTLYRYRLYPTQVGTDNDWKIATAGEEHTLAIKTDGTLWAWGLNWRGKLGIDNTDGIVSERRLSPTQVGTDTNWKTVTAGLRYTIAIKTDGTLWAWGDNTHGRLGLGDTTNRYYPIQVGTNTDWKVVDAGWGHTVALKNDSTLWAWGNNKHGQLGLGDDIDRLYPTQVGIDIDW